MTIVRLIIPCILVTIAASVDSQSLEDEIIKRQGFKPWNNAFLRWGKSSPNRPDEFYENGLWRPALIWEN